MQRLITIGIVAALMIYGFREYRSATETAEREREAKRALATERAPPARVSQFAAESPLEADPASPTAFRCDGRTRCAQMTSCEEAFYFLRNCPGVKMDGGGDGVPCERQWCGNR